MSSTATEKTTGRKALAGTLIGVVTSDARARTRTVAVAYQAMHPKYGKFMHRQAKYHVHDEKNQSKKGDRVEIAPCRRVSKTKSYRLLRIVEEAIAPIA